jgi:carboxyl-terminal processing protease
VGLAAGCTTRPTAPAAPHKLPESADLGALSWSQAFDRLYDKISREYAFTDFKGIDWQQLRSTYRPKIVAAEKAGDKSAYYLALREFLYSIPDGHVALTDPENGFGVDSLGVAQGQVGGGFGFTVAILGDGRLIADRVEADGPAAGEGMRVGAEILEWEGLSATEALRANSVLWATVPPATAEDTKYQQARFLVRSPVGAKRRCSFRNPGGSSTSARLVAIDDGMLPLRSTQKLSPMFFGEFPESMVETRTLEGGVGYVKIHAEGDLGAKHPGDHTPTTAQFDRAIESFVAAEAPGLIVDLRGNAGGADGMSAAFLGHFYARKTLYEYQNWYDDAAGRMRIGLPDADTGEVTSGGGLYIQPEKVRFAGPVTALVDNGCISSGEGVAMGIGRLENGSVIGFRGTNGSFGLVMGEMVVMPESFGVRYPVGQSLDAEKAVQLDSRDWVGGVAPSLPVPSTEANVLAAASGRDVELDYALRHIAQVAGMPTDY